MRVPKLPHLAALLLAAVPLTVMAQPVGQLPAQSNPGATQLVAPAVTPAPALAQTESQMQTATEQRISGLQAQLAITPAQMPQWTAFAQVMRENAQTTDALFRQRAAGVQSMNAAENMQSYAQLASTNAQDVQKLVPAFQALYDTMSDAQKRTADQVFRDDAHHGGHTRHS